MNTQYTTNNKQQTETEIVIEIETEIVRDGEIERE